MIKRALISVSAKKGIDDFARSLHEFGVEIVSTGGTATFLKEAGIPIVLVESITGFPEGMDGRVKTLHPKIHGGILARRIPGDEAFLDEHGIPRYDLVVVDLYHLAEYALDEDRTTLEVLEKIDIGGPTMIRAAAKNFPHGMTVICDPVDRQLVLDELKAYGRVREPMRAKLAAKVYAVMAEYNALAARRLYEEYGVPYFFLSSTGGKKLRYGTNPHQEKAWVFTKPTGLLGEGQWEIPYEGKPLSYTNWEEITYIVELVGRFHKDTPTAAVYKHESDCGVATHSTPASAFRRAWLGDSIASFGGTVGVNFEVDEKLARAMAKNFFEVLVCPKISKEALAVIRKKRKNLRVLTTQAVLGPQNGRWLEVKERLGLILVQERDFYIPSPDDFIQVSRKAATEKQRAELAFAAKSCQAMFSNATVISRGRMMIGYGRHGSSRVDTCQWSVEKAKQYKRDLRGSVSVTDGFFPFPDGLEVLANAGVKVIACPNAPTAGLRSQDVIDMADKLGVAFYHINHRLFRH